MGSAEAIRAVAEIIRSMDSGCVAVVSATSGTTDILIKLGNEALNGGDWETTLEALIKKHDHIMEGLEIAADLNGFWDELRSRLSGVGMLKELSLQTRDLLQTFGERISSTILAQYLRSAGIESQAVDAFELVLTDNNFGEGRVNFEETNSRVETKLRPLLGNDGVPVVTGFVAQSENGQYITLGRGGSDYTGAIIGAALKAEEVQIWTDVDGILNTDPRIVPEAKVLEQISFKEAGELAYFGAKVIHPKTIQPAIGANIAVKILNTFNVEAPGTLISNEETDSLKSVTYKKGITIINICSSGMLLAHGFLKNLFEVFAKHEVVVDVLATSEVSVSLTVEGEVAQEVLDDLGALGVVESYPEMAIVCLVGAGVRGDAEVLGNLFSAISDHDVSMVSQGASKRNITFLVQEAEAKTVVSKIFNQFF